MYRVTNYASNIMMNRHLSGIQERAFNLELQISSNKRAQSYSKISIDSRFLVTLENSRDSLERFTELNQLMDFRLDVTGKAISSIDETTGELLSTLNNQSLPSNPNRSQVENLQKWAFDSMVVLGGLLNTQADGRYVFSGTRNLTQSVDMKLTTLEDFQSKYDGYDSKYATTRDANLANFTFTNDSISTSGSFSDNNNWLTFRQDGDSNTLTGKVGSIESSSAMFANVAVGTNITVTNSQNNNGSYTVDSVSTDGTMVYVKTQTLTDEQISLSIPAETMPNALTNEGPISSTVTRKAGGAATTNITYNLAAGTITGGAGTLAAGFTAGDVIKVTGTASNDGTYVIDTFASGASDVITLRQNDTTITTNDGTVLTASDFGTFWLNSSDNSLYSSIPGAFSNVAPGSIIEVTNSFGSDDRYTIDWISSNGGKMHVKNVGDISLKHGQAATSITDFGSLQFNRALNTITSSVQDIFNGLTAGESFMVSGTAENDGTYAIQSISADGKTVTVDTNKMTDEGLGSGSNKFYNYSASTKSVFDATANTIKATDSAGAALPGVYSALLVGDSITVAGSAVAPALHTQSFFTNNGTPNVDTIQIRQSNGTTPATGVFSDFQIGDDIIVANSTGDNGTYTINSISEDGSTVTVNGDLPAATGVADAASASFSSAAVPAFALTTQNQVAFTGPDIIRMENAGAALVPNAFDNMSVGMSITLGGGSPNAGTYKIIAVNPAGFIQVQNLDGTVPALAGGPTVAGATISAAGNNGTYTVDSVSTDGSTVTLNPSTKLVANQTDSDGTTISKGGFSFTSGTKISIDAATNEIRVFEKGTGAAITDAFDGLRVGQRIDISGTSGNNIAYTIKAINVATGIITTNENITISEVDPSSTISVYATSGQVEADSYYLGDQALVTHRIDGTRNFKNDLNATNPAFEKAIRAMGILAQGSYGGPGSLENNRQRIEDVKFLLRSAINSSTVGDSPYGVEETDNLENIGSSVAMKRLRIEQVTIFHRSQIAFAEDRISAKENIDRSEAITSLLNEVNALEAAYQTISRVSKLSLVNFM